MALTTPLPILWIRIFILIVVFKPFKKHLNSFLPFLLVLYFQKNMYKKKLKLLNLNFRWVLVKILKKCINYFVLQLKKIIPFINLAVAIWKLCKNLIWETDLLNFIINITALTLCVLLFMDVSQLNFWNNKLLSTFLKLLIKII